MKEAFGSVTATKKVLICDDTTAPIINDLFADSELQKSLGLSGKPTLLRFKYSCKACLGISKLRQPLRGYDALYFISPTIESARYISKDFEGVTLLYENAHVFCSTMISDELLKFFAKSKAAQYISTLKEVQLEFRGK